MSRDYYRYYDNNDTDKGSKECYDVSPPCENKDCKYRSNNPLNSLLNLRDEDILLLILIFVLCMDKDGNEPLILMLAVLFISGIE